MAHYILTDAHEKADRFHAMLEKIQFSGNDKLEGESTYKL